MPADPRRIRGREYYVYDLDPKTTKAVKVGEAHVRIIWNRAFIVLTRTMNRHYQAYERPIEFRYSGVVIDRQYILTYRQRDMRSRSGACVLRSDPEGLILSGQALYYDDDTAHYVNMELHLKSTASHRPARDSELAGSTPI